MLEHDLNRQRVSPVERGVADATPPPAESDDEYGEEDVPTVVLYIIAGLLILSFSLYLIIGGGHSHFH